MTEILETIEGSLKDFRPRSGREFVALQIARRFDDLDRLINYLTVARDCPKRLMLEAARLATKKTAGDKRQSAEAFFQLIEQFRREEAA